MKTKLSTVAGLFMLAGCASTSAMRMRSYPARVTGCTVEVLNLAPTGRKFEEACLITARGGQFIWEAKSVDALVASMTAQACACGADAIVIRDAQEGGWNLFTGTEHSHASALAIKYVDR